MDFMPHGHCYYFTPEILWPMVAGDVMHVIAYGGLSSMLFFLCTREMTGTTPWLKPFLFLFACFIFTCGVSHAIAAVTIWNPLYRLQSGWLMLSGAVSVLTLLITLANRTELLSWLGVGRSTIFPNSRSFK